MKKTKEEIANQILRLENAKKTLPEISFFGGNNWEIIDAQIAVLLGNNKPDDYWKDEHAEEFVDGDNELWSEAERARRWMDGEEDEDLTDE